MRRLGVLLWMVASLAFAQDSFRVLDEAGESLFRFLSMGFRIFLVASFLGSIAFGSFLLIKKVRSAIAYAKQSGDEDPAMAGIKAAIPWGMGLFLFAVMAMAVLDYLTGGAFRQVVVRVLLGE